MEPLYGVLFSLFKEKPNYGQWVVACLKGAWPKLLGDRLAAVCSPVHFENANLRIEVCSPEWDQALMSVRETLLDKLRAATANEVRTITFSRQSAVGSRQYR
ncbi:MAG: DUF721 domain-containing protein [Acidobacteria bacterium]|nr:DUF721 domain-containing protein [Acidobacteriota bacterium]